MQVDVSAATVKERGTYKYGDSMGVASGWTDYTHNFYDKDGKTIRSSKLYQDPNATSITLSEKAVYIYDERGLLTETVNYRASATSPEDKDKEYVFSITNRLKYEYDENGRLVCQYQQKWAKNNTWDESTKTYYTEYTYNADGTKDEERYWVNYIVANPVEPVVTKYIYGDQGTEPVKTMTTGKYDSNWYDTEFTYDAQGRLIHSIATYTKEGYSKQGQIKEEKEWEYDGDFLVSVVNLSKTPNERTHYVMIDNDPNRYYEYTEKFDDETSEWKQSSPMFYEHVRQDYAGMENLVPELSATISPDNAQNANIRFSLPAIGAEAYAVKIYRDGAEIRTYTKDELATIYDGSEYYSFTDERLTNGGHEYFAMLLTGTSEQETDDYAESYISDIVTVEAVIPYPEVTDFHIKGYTLKNTWVDPQVDEETQETIEGYWIEDYKLVLEWTPLTADQVTDYNFDRYEIYYNSISGETPVAEFPDIATGTATVDWMDRYTEVWLNVKYGQDRVSTEHIAINLDELTNLSDADPIPAYGAYYLGGYTPAFAKVDLTRPEEDVETLYDLWSDSQADWNAVFGGVTVGNTYYAFFEDNNQDGLGLGAFNMSGKEYMQIGKPFTGDVESTFSDMAYDLASDRLYAVAPTETASYLYTIDRSTGEASRTDIALPEYTMLIASADSGKAYAMAAETGGRFQLYSVDLNAGTYAKVEGVSVAGTSNKWSSLLCVGNVLYFNANKTSYTIDLDTKTVTTNNDFKYAVSGLTLVESTELPEIGFVLSEDGHKITAEQSADGAIDYFYNADNALARVSEFNADGEMTRYTKNIFDVNGVMTATEVYEPETDAYGVESMQVAATSTYTYNEEGLLAEKKNSDSSWVRYTYEDGKVATEIHGSGETTERTLTYMYDEMEQPDGQAIMVMSESESNPDDNYVDAFRYDEMGNKVSQARVKDLLTGEYISLETWEYFENSNLVSAHNICSTTEFVEGQPVVISSTRYMMVENNPNHLMSQEFDGENPIEGTARNLVYADLTGPAAKAQVDFTVSKVEDSANDVRIAFGYPAMSYTEPYSLDIYRDGILLRQLSSGEISSMSELELIDEKVANGEHEYIIRANAFGMNDESVALQISPISEITLDTELPAVSDIAFVRYEQKYLDAEGNIDENATEGDHTYVVTIGWTNPEIPADYGFTGNHLFLMDGTTPTAAGVITDAAVAETTIDAGTATTFNIMIQSHYALGVANSDTQEISFSGVGVDGIGEDCFTVKVVDRQVIASSEATLSVFDMNGTRVAAAYGERLDLSALNGTYIVTAERDGAVRIVKVML